MEIDNYLGASLLSLQQRIIHEVGHHETMENEIQTNSHRTYLAQISQGKIVPTLLSISYGLSLQSAIYHILADYMTD